MIAHEPNRFPGGESYSDMIDRLWPVIIDLEQTLGPAAIVSHVSVLQVLLSYFRATPVSQSIQVEVPMHTVFKFVPLRGGGWLESQHVLLPDDDVAEPRKPSSMAMSGGSGSGSQPTKSTATLPTICSSSQLFPAEDEQEQQRQEKEDEDRKDIIWGDSRSCMPNKLE